MVYAEEIQQIKLLIVNRVLLRSISLVHWTNCYFDKNHRHHLKRMNAGFIYITKNVLITKNDVDSSMCYSSHFNAQNHKNKAYVYTVYTVYTDMNVIRIKRSKYF